MLTGLVLFSHMARLHPRYVEGFTPAVAALLGIGLAWATAPRGRLRLAALAVAMIVTVYYAERLLYGTEAAWWFSLLGALAAVALRARSRGGPEPRARPAGCGPGRSRARWSPCSPSASKRTSGRSATRSAPPASSGRSRATSQRRLSTYLHAHDHGARYEVAAESATQIGSLIVQDAKPIAVLTTYNARVYTSVAKLKHMIAAGQVRYAYLSSFCGHKASSVNAACSAPVVWIREHGTDVSKQAGMPEDRTLYLLPGAKP